MRFPKVGGRTILRSLLAILVICAIVGVVLLVNDYREFKHELTVFRGVKLADTRGDVEYRLGAPKAVLGPVIEAGPPDDGWGPARRVYTVNGPEGDQNAMPEGKSTSDYDAWVYSDDNSTDESFYFDAAGKVKEVSCVTFGTHMSACGPVARIWSLDPEAKVLRLGNPSFVKLDHGTKTIRFDDIGLEVWLTKAKVYSIRVMRPKGGEGAILSRYLHTLMPDF